MDYQCYTFSCSVMAPISNPVMHGTLSEKELAKAFSAERRTVNILSTEFDSSMEGNIGGESSLWESSEWDVTGDESADDSTQFSGSILGDGFAFDQSLQAISIESTDSGIEGNNEEPVHRYAVRPRKKTQCKPPPKCTCYGDTSGEDEALASGGSLPSQHSGGYVGRGRGGGSRGRKRRLKSSLTAY